MKPSSSTADLSFALRFYQQSAEAILTLVETAKRSHPGITGWTQVSDSAAAIPRTTVTLRFRDRESFETFIKDERFVETYLAGAWSRRPLARDALRVEPFRGDEHGAIPQDLFSEVGF